MQYDRQITKWRAQRTCHFNNSSTLNLYFGTEMVATLAESSESYESHTKALRCPFAYCVKVRKFSRHIVMQRRKVSMQYAFRIFHHVTEGFHFD